MKPTSSMKSTRPPGLYRKPKLSAIGAVSRRTCVSNAHRSSEKNMTYLLAAEERA